MHDVQRGDIIELNAWANLAYNIRLVGEIHHVHGTEYIDIAATTVANGRVTQTQRVLHGGELVRLQVTQAFLADAAIAPGACFVMAEMFRSTLRMDNYLSAYLTSARSVVLDMHQEPGTGPGAIRTLGGANPAAGIDPVDTVPANSRWRLTAYTISLTTDVTVATRIPTLIGATYRIVIKAITGQPASLTRTWTFIAGNDVSSAPEQSTVDGVTTVLSLRKLPFGPYMDGGETIRLVTLALQAGDNYGGSVLDIEEWVMPNVIAA